MKFTLSWLKDHLETDASLTEICNALTMIGLEVESVDDKSDFLPFTIARVLKVDKHPNADKLKVLSVDKGDGKLISVVCGASNVRVGLIGVFAPPSTYIPGTGITLSVNDIRGVKSFGMMCSERELQISDEHEGIIDLEENCQVGKSFADYAGLSDPLIEIAVTPNRSDVLSVAGIARDLEAFGIGRLKPVEITPPKATFLCPVNVKLDFNNKTSLCTAFSLCYIRGIKNLQSPKWMQARLRAIGLKPVSALVDVTNYITFDLGFPLHVFDADKISGDLLVRSAADGESIQALDGKNYELKNDNCVIADNKGIQSLSGIIGGEKAACSYKTVNVLLESALWKKSNIARTGRDLNIITDARYRFERGVDQNLMQSGLNYAITLITKLCGGDVSETVTAGKILNSTTVIEFPLHEIKRLTGISITNEDAILILKKLGFNVFGIGSIVRVSVPSWRFDISGKADLVEEIVRIHGVHNIIPKPLPKTDGIVKKKYTVKQTRSRNIRRALASRGMFEEITWTFISKIQAQTFSYGYKIPELVNPISASMSHMRPSLLPGLLATSQYNIDHGIRDLAMFEAGSVFHGEEPKDQKYYISAIRRGYATFARTGRHWQSENKTVDVFDAKQDAFSILSSAGINPDKVQIKSSAPNWYHPGRSATIYLGPKLILGSFGELHPLTLEKLDISGSVCGCEINLDNIPEPRNKSSCNRGGVEIPRLQKIYRDFAFLVSTDTKASTIIRAAMNADKNLIKNINVFDVFEDNNLGCKKKSVAIEVTIQAKDHTLNEKEIEIISSKIVNNVEKNTGGSLRT